VFFNPTSFHYPQGAARGTSVSRLPLDGMFLQNYNSFPVIRRCSARSLRTGSGRPHPAHGHEPKSPSESRESGGPTEGKTIVEAVQRIRALADDASVPSAQKASCLTYLAFAPTALHIRF
jgi:hypothetical protein